jgi:hypothetical protein
MNKIANKKKHANKIKQKSSKNDIYYTPLPVAKKMIDMCNITSEMKVLDPSLGGGIFYDNLPECKKEWCEIAKGKDFFLETEKYDLIIGNPPYSLWDKWLDKTMELTDKFCYIFGTLNLTTLRLNKIFNKGYGITHFYLVDIDWWFGRYFCVVFEKNKQNIIEVSPKIILCDICNTKCQRGRKGNNVNTCYFINK